MSMTGWGRATTRSRGRLGGVRLVIPALLVCTLAGPGLGEADAGLHWEKPVQDFQLMPGADDLEVDFRFKNTGPRTVRIKRMRTSCGCLTAGVKRREYAPGEAGVIEALFKIGDRVGMQAKSILVETDDPDQPTSLIGMRVLIRSSVELSRRILIWRRNGEPRPQNVTIEVVREQPMQIAQVLCSNPLFRTKVRTLEPGRKYDVLVEPSATDKRAAAIIRIVGDHPPKHPPTFTIRARIK